MLDVQGFPNPPIPGVRQAVPTDKWLLTGSPPQLMPTRWTLHGIYTAACGGDYWRLLWCIIQLVIADKKSPHNITKIQKRRRKRERGGDKMWKLLCEYLYIVYLHHCWYKTSAGLYHCTIGSLWLECVPFYMNAIWRLKKFFFLNSNVKTLQACKTEEFCNLQRIFMNQR